LNSLAATASFSATEPPACLHPMGEKATQPIEQRYGTLVALLLGISLLRRRALPAQTSQPNRPRPTTEFRFKKPVSRCWRIWPAAMPVEQGSD